MLLRNKNSITNTTTNNSSSPPSSSAPSSSDPLTAIFIDSTTTTPPNKRKRRPAGTPDPDAEVVSLSPKTLLESDRYVCEICNQGFQRDQNLQMHRRRHKVPWKLLKRENPVVRKRVFVCPEPTCLHHDPCHALGDLVGIKKHFRRKHSNHKQWVCDKCSKAYAVQSDYKAHLKTCGTRGHSCDCGRVFSRVESFIEHQDACHMGRLRPDQSPAVAAAAVATRRQPSSSTAVCLSRTGSSPSPSNDTRCFVAPQNMAWAQQAAAAAACSLGAVLNPTTVTAAAKDITSKSSNTAAAATAHSNMLMGNNVDDNMKKLGQSGRHNLELQLLTCCTSSSQYSGGENATAAAATTARLSSSKTAASENHSTQLQLSIGSSSENILMSDKNAESIDQMMMGENKQYYPSSSSSSNCKLACGAAACNDHMMIERVLGGIKEEACEQLKLAMADKAYAEEARREAKRQIEIAEREFANAKRIRQRAQAEIDKANALKEHAMKQISSTLLQITCHACKLKFHNREGSLGVMAADQEVKFHPSLINNGSVISGSQDAGEVQ